MNMKRTIFLFIISFVALLSSCSDEKLNDSIFDDSERGRTEFDLWLLSNYTYPYNIDFKYRMEDIESDITYTLAPAELGKSIKLAKLVKHLWLEAYDEVAGIDFTRTYIPKVIHLIGSPAYDIRNAIILGTAEGGLKVTLYMVNYLDEIMEDKDGLNYYYFHVMHHEFAHILHQTKKYDPDFKKISDTDYIGGDWVNVSDSEAYQAGFVSPYSMSAPDEDFVEIISIFITSIPKVWNDMLTEAGKNGAPGANILNRKFEMVANYLKDLWKIDIYDLRDIVQRRTAEINQLDLDKL